MATPSSRERPFTPEEDEFIKNARLTRNSWDRISKKLGRARSSCIDRGKAIGAVSYWEATKLKEQQERDGIKPRRLLGKEPLPAGHPHALAILEEAKEIRLW